MTSVNDYNDNYITTDTYLSPEFVSNLCISTTCPPTTCISTACESTTGNISQSEKNHCNDDCECSDDCNHNNDCKCNDNCECCHGHNKQYNKHRKRHKRHKSKNPIPISYHNTDIYDKLISRWCGNPNEFYEWMQYPKTFYVSSRKKNDLMEFIKCFGYYLENNRCESDNNTKHYLMMCKLNHEYQHNIELFHLYKKQLAIWYLENWRTLIYSYLCDDA